jgi:hypothetical protein
MNNQTQGHSATLHKAVNQVKVLLKKGVNFHVAVGKAAKDHEGISKREIIVVLNYSRFLRSFTSKAKPTQA